MNAMTIEKLYSNAAGSWTRCEWTTDFGDYALDLDGCTAEEARTKAEALRDRADAWDSAALYLEEIESEAERAEKYAAKAIEAYREGRVEEAAEFADKAAFIERGYGDALVWGPLARALSALAKLQ